MTSPIYLIACVAKKGNRRAAAAELYQSDWFCKARTFVRGTGADWYILSAAHGLIKPNRRIDPYDASLTTMTAAQRRAWGDPPPEYLISEPGG